ncbi:MAG: glycosyltransferase family 39 protein, partial [Planctomycetota bacterium]
LQFKRAFPALTLEEVNDIEQEILASMRQTKFWRRVDWTGRDDTPESFDLVERGFSAAHQPPGYYLTCAPLLLALRSAPIEARLITLRAFSLLLFIGTVLFTYRAARYASEDERVALLAGLFVALWPMSARGGALVSNDVLARFLVAGAFYFSARRLHRGDLASLIGLILACILALVTKTTAASAVGIALLALLLAPGQRKKLRTSLLAAVALGFVALAGTSAWIDSHNPAIPPGIQSALDRMAIGLSGPNLRELGRSFVGGFNWESRNLPEGLALAWVVGLGAFALLGALPALKIFARRSDILREEGAADSTRQTCLALGAVLIQFMLIVGRGVGKGRYLMP